MYAWKLAPYTDWCQIIHTKEFRSPAKLEQGKSVAEKTIPANLEAQLISNVKKAWTYVTHVKISGRAKFWLGHSGSSCRLLDNTVTKPKTFSAMISVQAMQGEARQYLLICDSA
jgi:hypothetical protein